MTAIKLYNTRTKLKEEFKPLDPDNVRMYVCGPTVYDLAHIGNARPIIVFDVLFRLLRHIYGPDRVTYARNITDIDDKIIARAAERGISIEALTAETTRQFHEDIRALAVLTPDDINEEGKPPRFIEPRATGHIPEMIVMIGQLIERGHAYDAEGHVLFDVASDPDYGKLARRTLDEMRAGARIDVAPYKRDAMDFVLWKPSAGSEPGWESPWGFGRPGWHLECSAMAKKHLGSMFDIHGGGIDLLFPHHENEVAQSTCAHGTGIMANVWMHNGHLQVEGAKMSKSEGNFVTIKDLLQSNTFGGQRWHGKVLRFAMLGAHYRQPMDWTVERLTAAMNTLNGWTEALRGLDRDASGETPEEVQDAEFMQALSDDLNTPAAIARLHVLWNQGPPAHGKLARALTLLGLYNADGVENLLPHRDAENFADSALVEDLIGKRIAARNAKDWAEADRIRDELVAMGIAIMDAKNPATGEIETTWKLR